MNPAWTSPRLRTLATALLVLLLLPLLGANADARTKHGVRAGVAHRKLTIVGDRHANRITLRLKRHASNTLQVVLGANGSPVFSFDRRRFSRIALGGRGGNDRLRIDESRGAFTKTERTSIDGGTGDDSIAGGAGRE